MVSWYAAVTLKVLVPARSDASQVVTDANWHSFGWRYTFPGFVELTFLEQVP